MEWTSRAAKKPSKAGVVEEAKAARERRAAERARQAPARTVARVIRGHATRVRVQSDCAERLSRKLGDVEKLRAVLAAAGAPFTLPPAAATPLIRDAALARARLPTATLRRLADAGCLVDGRRENQSSRFEIGRGARACS